MGVCCTASVSPKAPLPGEEEGSPWFPGSCLPPCSEYGGPGSHGGSLSPEGPCCPPTPSDPLVWGPSWGSASWWRRGAGVLLCRGEGVDHRPYMGEAGTGSFPLPLLRGRAASPAFFLFHSVAKAESSPSLPPFHPGPFLLGPGPPAPPNLGVSSRLPSLGGWDFLCPTPSSKGLVALCWSVFPSPLLSTPSLSWEWP